MKRCLGVSSQIGCNDSKLNTVYGNFGKSASCSVGDNQLSKTSLIAGATHKHNKEFPSHVQVRPIQQSDQPRAPEKHECMESAHNLTTQKFHGRPHSLSKSAMRSTDTLLRQQPGLEHDIAPEGQTEAPTQLNRDTVIELFERLESFRMMANIPEMASPSASSSSRPPYAGDRRRSLQHQVVRTRPRTHLRSESCGHLKFYVG